MSFISKLFIDYWSIGKSSPHEKVCFVNGDELTSGQTATDVNLISHGRAALIWLNSIRAFKLNRRLICSRNQNKPQSIFIQQSFSQDRTFSFSACIWLGFARNRRENLVLIPSCFNHLRLTRFDWLQLPEEPRPRPPHRAGGMILFEHIY